MQGPARGKQEQRSQLCPVIAKLSVEFWLKERRPAGRQPLAKLPLAPPGWGHALPPPPPPRVVPLLPSLQPLVR